MEAMETNGADDSRRTVDEQRETLDFIGNSRDFDRLEMKQNVRESVSTEDVDAAKCDETSTPLPPHARGDDDVAPDDVEEEETDKTKDPDYVEERFRVDRRKLEQLIQTSEEDEENAEEFFKKIMSETNTHIAWPSKLKIGAKSKKDPHIKVSGHKDSVSEAKSRILSVLDTKSLRVTLKMDVSHTEHSHVIGKSGHNIKRVMQETGCHIHFPDSNRNTLAEKSNQVSIAGLCEGVELARTRIRELLPLVFMFEVPMTGPNQTNIDSNSTVIQNIQLHYGVSINIKTRHQVFVKTVIVRGSVCNSKSVKKAAAMVFELFTGRVGEAFGVSMLLDIASQHHLFIIGHGGANINRIMQHTGATINFPDPAAIEPQRRGTVCITGTMSSVFLAQHQLLGCLPLVLMFDLKEDIEIDQGLLSQLMEQLDVFISIKPKPKQTTKSVIVKTIESNTQNVYEARRRILGLAQEVPMCEMKSGWLPAAPLMADNIHDYQSGSRGTNSCFDLMTGVKNLRQLESHPTTVANAASKNPGYRPMPMMFPHQHPSRHPGTAVYPPFYPSPPFSYMPSYGIREWMAFPPGRHPLPSSSSLPPDRLQHATIPTEYPVMQTQRSGVLNGAEDQVLHLTSLSMSQMTSSLSPLNVSVSSRNLRGVPGGVLPQLHPHPSSSLPFAPSPLPLDFLSSNVISNLSGDAALTANLVDLFGDAFDAKSALQSDVQHSFIRNQLDPTLTGLHRQPNSSSGAFGSASAHPTAQPYTAKTGYCHTAPLYPIHPGVSSPSLSTISSVLCQDPFSHQYSVHDAGRFPALSDQGNDVCCNTFATHPTLTGSGAAPMGYHPVNGSVYIPGTKQLMDEERHDLLEEHRQHTYPVQDGDVERDGDRESDCSSEMSNGSRAPGSNRPKKSINNCHFEGGAFLLNETDYEHMKALASKAMQKKPVGESRIPTDYWAGLGFSRSMPASEIRDRLNPNDSSYDGPKMTTPYEDVEEDCEAWKIGVNSVNQTVGNDSIMDLVSQLSAQCRELSLQQQDRCDVGQIDGHRQLSSSRPSSSVWQPLGKSRTDCDAICVVDTDVSLLFSEMGLGKYAELFRQQEIDMQTFLTLTDQDLKDLGITTLGARRKMLLAIADLNRRQSLLPPPPGLPNPFRDAGIIRRHDIVSQSVRW